MPLRLNLASGSDARVGDGWQNLDIVKQWPNSPRPCDVLWDARTDRIPYGDATVDEIVAGYLLLHVSRDHHVPLVREMFRVMKPGARLVVDEVDMALAMRRWLADPTDQQANDMCFGEQGNVHGEHLAQYDKHCSGLTDELLVKLLTDAGFRDVRKIRLHADEVWWQMTYEAWKP